MVSRSHFVLCLLAALAVGPSPADARPARPAPALPAPSGPIVTVSTEAQLQSAVRSLTSNTTIVIAPGTYALTRTLYVKGVSNVGIRGASANPDDVVLIGPGMSQENYGEVPFGIWAGDGVDGITIANVTIKDFYFHPIIFNAGAENPRVYNVHLIDAGEQFIKVNPDGVGGGVDNGVVEYSVIEFTTTGRSDYPKGVDIQTAKNWIVRNNLFRNLLPPGGALSGPGVLAWRGSSNTTVEGNTFVNCTRSVMLGADDYYSPSQSGGIIRNNIVYRSAGVPGDVGLMLTDSPDTQVLNNTVYLSGTYPSPIEYRYTGTRNALIANNLVDGAITSRDGGSATLVTNVQGAGPGNFVDLAGADLHLSALALAAIDRGTALPGVVDDWDGQARPQGSGYDIGADERAADSGATTPAPASATAAFVTTDTTTRGSWIGTYGGDGSAIAAGASALPSYATVAVSSAASWTWASATADVRAPQQPAGDRVAACWYAGGSFVLDINLTDGGSHQVALYLLDWDGWGRSVQAEVVDAGTGAVLDTKGASGFQNGQYLVWSLSGHVLLRLTNTGPQNAVASALLFGAGGATTTGASGTTAAFVKADDTTQGNWNGVYGSRGYALAGDAALAAAWTQPTIAGASPYTWLAATSDLRAVRRPDGSSRLAACWYADNAMTLDVNVQDGASHSVALYLLDWDSWGRAQRVEVIDTATGAVLDTRSVASFSDGRYLVWTVSGHVAFRIVNSGNPNAVVSAVFLD